MGIIVENMNFLNVWRYLGERSFQNNFIMRNLGRQAIFILFSI